MSNSGVQKHIAEVQAKQSYKREEGGDPFTGCCIITNRFNDKDVTCLDDLHQEECDHYDSLIYFTMWYEGETCKDQKSGEK